MKQKIFFSNSKAFVEESMRLTLLKLLEDDGFNVTNVDMIYRSNSMVRDPKVLHGHYDDLNITLIIIKSQNNTFGGFINTSFLKCKDDICN
jgi:hypothetical protein